MKIESLQRHPVALGAALKPSNATGNAAFALRRALNGAALGSTVPFMVSNGTLNGSVPFDGPNFVPDGEVEA